MTSRNLSRTFGEGPQAKLVAKWGHSQVKVAYQSEMNLKKDQLTMAACLQEVEKRRKEL